MMGWFVSVLIVLTVILATAFVISRLINSRPSVCDFIWRAALILVVLTPEIVVCRETLVDWHWQLPVWPASAMSLPTASAPTTVRIEVPRQISRTPDLRKPIDNPILHLKEDPAVRTSKSASNAASLLPPLTTQEIKAAQVTATVFWSWEKIVLAIWLVGSLLHLAKIASSAWKVWRLGMSTCNISDSDCLALNQECAEMLSLRYVPRLTSQSNLASPVVIGIFWPQIILPSALLSKSRRRELRAVLLHECGHVRRHDLAFDLLLRIVIAAFWPHPLIYVMAREIQRLREEMCDNFVLAQERAVNFAEILLHVAVGQRLNNTQMLGIGVVSTVNRLEQRVASILSPQRRIETGISRRVRLIANCLICGLLAIGLMVRLTPLAAAPPKATTEDEVEAAAKSRTQSREEAMKQSLEKAIAAIMANPIEVKFRVVDSQGKPVVGAKVNPKGALSFGGGYWDGKWNPSVSDAEGFVRFPIPEEIIRAAIAMKGFKESSGKMGHQWDGDRDRISRDFPDEFKKVDIRKLYLQVDHPDHPLWWDYLELGPNPQIQLAESYTIQVRAQRNGETEFVERIVPQLFGSHSTDWSEVDGVVTLRRVDLGNQQGRQSIRIVHFAEQGPAWFSDVVDLTHIAGNPILMDMTLNPGVRLAGRLSDDVPRPVKHGRIVGKMIELDDKNQCRSVWNIATEIADNGTFVLDSLPRNGTLQLIARCDDWNSRSPTQTEVKAFQSKYKFPIGEVGFATAATVHPQLIHVEEAGIHDLVVPMVQTTSCEVTAVDNQNRPVPGVNIQFNPNEVYFGWGSTGLGTGQDDASQLLVQLRSGVHDVIPAQRLDERKFCVETDEHGKATIVGLPCAGSDAPASHQMAMFFAAHEEYIAQVHSAEKIPQVMGMPILMAKLVPANSNKLTIRMIPRPLPNYGNNLGPNGEALLQVDPGNGIELKGRVEDVQGRPIEGVKVLIGNEDSFQIRTDAQGKFSYKSELEMFDPDELAILPISFVKDGFAILNRSIQLTAEGVTIQLSNDTWFEGVVRKPDGTPAANVPIRAFYDWHMGDVRYEVATLKVETTSDAGGRYRLLVEPNSYRFVAGTATAGVAWLPKDGINRNGEPLKLQISSDEHQNLDLQLEPSVRFVAELIDSITQKPVLDAYISFRNNLPLEEISEKNDSGLVTYPALPAGKTDFVIYSPKYLRVYAEEAIPTNAVDQESLDFTGNCLTFDLQPDMTPVKIFLEPGVEVSGVVLDPEGQPVSNAEVYLTTKSSRTNKNLTDRFSYSTNQEGRFQFLLPISGAETYLLVARERQSKDAIKKWSSGISQPLVLEADKPVQNLEICLTEPGTIRGRIVDRHGLPVASVFVQSTNVDLREKQKYSPSATSHRDGTFEIRHVRPGRYWLSGKSAPTDADAAGALPQALVQSKETTQVGDVFIPVNDAEELKE